MSENSKIEWCDHTFNPFIGCTKVSPGCDNCYAEHLMDKRMHKVVWGTKDRLRTSAANWRKPLQWNKAHDEFKALHGRRQRVFCASLADVFDNAVDPAWRDDLWELIWQTPNLDWLLLTKRIGNVISMLPDKWGNGVVPYWPNVWIGATIVNQEEAERDIPKLLLVPARVRFLSMEPLLGAVTLQPHWLEGEWEQGVFPTIDWVIVGGESGAGARPMHPDWPRSLRDQCAAVETPFLFKQWGEFVVPEDGSQVCRVCGCTWNNACPGGCCWIEPDLCSACEGMTPADGDRPVRYLRVGKRAAGRQLDGRTHDEFPRGAL